MSINARTSWNSLRSTSQGHVLWSSSGKSNLEVCGLGWGSDREFSRVDGHRLGGVVSLVDADQAVCQLKHIVAQADDDKLGVLGALLDVVRHNGHILEVCTTPCHSKLTWFGVSLEADSAIAHSNILTPLLGAFKFIVDKVLQRSVLGGKRSSITSGKDLLLRGL